jgi:heme-degrading monooxygenase HmoA
MHITTLSGLSTVLSRTRTAPDSQAQVLDAWITAAQAWQTTPGFVAGALLRSLDQQRVIAYLQYQLPTAPLDVTPPLDGLGVSTDSHLYEVVSLEAPPDVSISALSIALDDGLTTLVNVFDTDPPRQQELVDTWLTVGKPFTHHPGFVDAALHRSTDGTRVVNYAHWRHAADWQDLASKSGQEFGRFRPLGTSDPHLYAVVRVIERQVG